MAKIYRKDDNSRSVRQGIEKNNVGEHTAIASNLNRRHDRKNFRFQNPELYLLRKPWYAWWSFPRAAVLSWRKRLFLLEIRGTTRRPRTFSP